jgi:hypothetical protein
MEKRMNKKHLISGLAAMLVVLSGSASAEMYDFEDMIDHWNPFTREAITDPVAIENCEFLDWVTDSVYISECGSLAYTHDLTDDVDFGAGDRIISATLELDFTNDNGDGHFWIIYDNREYAEVYLKYDPASASYVEVEDLGEIDNGQYDLQLDIDWLNEFHQLDVCINVSNPLGMADASLDHSRLYGTVEAVPVPGAFLLGMLGLGAAGVRLRKHA